MIELYLYLFVVICIGLLGWGLMRLERVYQYPFFMGAIFTSFLLPQAFALYENPNEVTETALARVYLMCCLCAVMCWLGYQIVPNPKWIKKLDIPINEHKLFKTGVVLMIIGYVFTFLVTRSNIENAANGNWTGRATIYIFFAQVLYIAFAIFLLLALKYRTQANIICTILAGIPLLMPIIEAGRRQATMTFLIIIGLCFWYAKRYILPRWIVIGLVFLGIYIIPVFGTMRGDFWTSLFINDFDTIITSSQDSLNSLMQGDILELRNAAMMMDAVSETGHHGYGAGYWDAIVFQYVPGQIFGQDFKASLQFKSNNYIYNYLYFLHGYLPSSGTTPTGIGDSFVEFNYFGCLFFALMGLLFRVFWISSIYLQSFTSKLLYMGLISPAMLAVTHGTGRFIQQAIFQFIFISLTIYFSKAKYRHKQKSYSKRLDSVS